MDVNGNFLWAKTYGGPDWDYAYSVEQTADSGYIICGKTWSFGSGNADIYLMKTDRGGNALWTEAYGDTHRDIGNSVQQTEDGGYIVTGETISYGAGRGDLFLLKTHADGNTMCMRTYGDTLHQKGQSVQQAPDGGYIAVGETWSSSAGKSDIYIVGTDSLGNPIWYKSYGDAHYDYASSIKPTRDGGYVAGGWTDSYGAGAKDVYLLRTAPEIGIEEGGISIPNLPRSLAILEVSPNPSSGKVKITFAITQDAESVALGIYDVIGRPVKSFSLLACDYSLPISIICDGQNDKSERMASGICFVRLGIGDFGVTRKITLLG